MEQIIENRKCGHCSENYGITDKDIIFYDKVSPSFNSRKISIPSPKLCPQCRNQRRLVWRNESKLYKRKCDATGKNIISMYSPDKAFKVYDQAFWWSDKWDALDYGFVIDYSKDFFEQYKTLILNVPHKALINNYETNINTNYANFSGNNKDSYLIFEAGSSEKAFYSKNIRKSDNIVDCLGIQYCNNTYELIDSTNCTNVFYSQDCKNSHNSSFLINCTDCTYCFMCNDLENKKYHINNRVYTKEDYYKELQNLRNSGNIPKDYNAFTKQIPKRIVKSMHGFGNENCNGDYIYNSKEVSVCFEVKNLECSKFCSVMSSSDDVSRDCYDYDYFGFSQKSYEIITVGQNAHNILFSVNCWENVSNLIYCINCKLSKNCFGCFGLIGGEYCILNKQYTKEEYNKTVSKIIQHMKKTGEWGEFFPASLSPFGYNETVAQEYFPLTQGQDSSFNWSNFEAPKPQVQKIITADKLTKDITEIPDDILNWAIECKTTKKPFRIVPQELEFYRKHNLPIPRIHPDQRHLDRMKFRNPRKLFNRDCNNCGIKIQTTYSPDRPEIIYCEECYNKEKY